MFLDLLGDVEKVAFSRLAYALIASYGVDEHEEKLFQAALAEMGLYEPDLEGPIQVEVEAAAFQSTESQRIALIELMLLALADGHLDTEEQHILDTILGAFGFDADTLDDAWNWVRDYHHLTRRASEWVGLSQAAPQAATA